MDVNRIIEIDFERCFKALILYSRAIFITTLAFMLIGIGLGGLVISQDQCLSA